MEKNFPVGPAWAGPERFGFCRMLMRNHQIIEDTENDKRIAERDRGISDFHSWFLIGVVVVFDWLDEPLAEGFAGAGFDGSKRRILSSSRISGPVLRKTISAKRVL